MSVTQKTRTQNDVTPEQDEELSLTTRQDDIEDPIKDVLSAPEGPLTSEDTTTSNSEVEADGVGQVGEVATRLSKALKEKDEKLS
ncbi:MAG: hypothetical protein P8R54_04515 [Myxococcota bacterium]|nr:hypothetical protein [Myxococcota bacterium]